MAENNAPLSPRRRPCPHMRTSFPFGPGELTAPRYRNAHQQSLLLRSPREGRAAQKGRALLQPTDHRSTPGPTATENSPPGHRVRDIMRHRARATRGPDADAYSHPALLAARWADGGRPSQLRAAMSTPRTFAGAAARGGPPAKATSKPAAHNRCGPANDLGSSPAPKIAPSFSGLEGVRVSARPLVWPLRPNADEGRAGQMSSRSPEGVCVRPLGGPHTPRRHVEEPCMPVPPLSSWMDYLNSKC